MSSLHSIPEPSVAYRPVDDDPLPAGRPITTTSCDDYAVATQKPARSAEYEEQIGSATWLIVLMLCGIALRLLMFNLGPLQGIGAELNHVADAWRSVIALPGQSSISNPAYAFLGWSIISLGLPAWTLILIQLVLGVAAIPATYIVGHALTGRRIAGLAAALVIALHPGLLTQTIAYHPAALAAALVAIGFAILCHEKTRKPSTAWLGAGLLGLAGLMSPLVLAASIAVAVWLILNEPTRKGAASVLLIIILGVLPPILWGLTNDTSLSAPIPESSMISQPTWAALTTPAMGTLESQLHVDLNGQGPLLRVASQATNEGTASNNLAAYLGDGWLLLNALLWTACCISIALLIYRRRFATAIAIGAAAGWIAIVGMPMDEAGRMPLIALWAVAAAALFSNTPPPRYSEEELEQIRQDRDEKRNAKLEDKLERSKSKSDIYSFDRPKSSNTPAVSLSDDADTPSPNMRPI